ncbi:hypothetical protein D9613_004845 [Agrocybe pediades]|uniref:BTB domain-containing protein n=1 Tax=Agrocybe pediades TaxID=84607 RepID=A0A8H4QYT3_9AGAR|nr:hypothetical protein D9613_004845 [Agrocybe pediades]
MAITLDYNFDAPDADIILLSSDSAGGSTEFHLHQCILSAASPFFHDMFSLPQGDHFTGKLPVIPISEPAHVIDILLRFVYPISRPAIASLDELCLVLGAAVKYDFGQAILSLRTLLLTPRFLRSSPIRVYAVASQYDFIEEAEVAARHTLSVSLLDAPPCEDLKYINAYDYHQLLRLHQDRSAAAVSLLKTPENVKCMQCNGSVFTMHDAPKWWSHFENAARKELEKRPTTDVVFGIDFVFKAARESGCSRCPESVLDSWKFLAGLKEVIDGLPAMISIRQAGR